MAVIEAVTFDLWQTLIIDDRERGRARARLRIEGAWRAIKEAGQDIPLEQVQEAYRRCYRTCHQIHAQERDIPFHQQVDIFINYIHEGLSQRLDGPVTAIISDRYAEAFFDFPPPVASEACGVLEELQRRGYHLGMISNTGMTPGRLFRRYLAQHNLLAFFDVLTFSDEVGLCKPSPEMFLLTLRTLGTTPDKAVHVGDHITNDILGANRVGMRSILLGDGEGQEKVATPHVRIRNLRELPATLEILGS